MTAKPNDRERLQHIITAIDRIKKFSKGMSYSQFVSDEMAQFAIIKNFEIIGEAAYHISKEMKQQSPEIEWRKLEVFRHKLVHDYYEIDLDIIWRTRNEKLDQLKKRVANIMRDQP